MHWVHTRELLSRNVLHHSPVLLTDEASADCHSRATAEKLGNGRRGGLVVNDFTLLRAALLSFKLATHAAVACSVPGGLHREVTTTGTHDHATDAHHDGVHNAGVALDAELAFLVNIAEAHEHIVAGNAHFVERGPSVVLGAVANLGSEITTLNTGEDFPRLHVPDLYHEGLHTVFISIDDETGEDDSMATEAAKVAWPVLGGLNARSIDDELVCGHVKRGSSQKASDVRTMADLCLSVAAEDVQVGDQGEPFGFLLGVRQVLH